MKKPQDKAKSNPLEEAKKLIELENKKVAETAGNKYKEFIEQLEVEFGVKVTYETIINFTKI